MKNLGIFFWIITICNISLNAQDGSSCNMAVKASVGENHAPSQNYWYSYTLPENNKKIIFLYSGLNDDPTALFVYSDCDYSYLEQRYSVNGVLRLEINSLDSLDTIYFTWQNYYSADSIHWTLIIEDNGPGDICSDPIIAVEGENAFSPGISWYSYTSTKMNQKVLISSKDLYYANGVFSILDSCNGSSINYDFTIIGDSALITVPLNDSGEVFLLYINSYDTAHYKFYLLCKDILPGELCNAPITAVEGLNHTSSNKEWYSFTAPGESKKITITSVGYTDKDTYVSAFDSCNGNCIAWNDDYQGAQSKIILYDRGINEPFVFEWGDYNLNSNGFDWYLSVDNIEPGDVCRMAKEIAEGTFALPETDMWYEFIVPESDKKIQLSSDIFNTGEYLVEIYDACNGNLLASNYNSWQYPSEITLYNLNTQQSIMIHIYRYYPSTQSYSWKLSVKDIPELSIPEEVIASFTLESNGSEIFTVSNNGNEEMNCSVVSPKSAMFVSNNDYIYIIPNISDTDPTDRDLVPHDKLTISFWIFLNENINCDKQNNWRLLISKGVAFYGNGGYDIILEEDGHLTFSVGTTGGFVRYHTNKRIISPLQWTHITAIFDALTGEAAIYVDGIKTTGSYWTTAIGEIMNNYDPLFIGYPSYSECQEGFGYFPGILDELSIWNRVITEEEILSGMLNQITGNETGLIGFWDFDEIHDGRVYDLSPSKNEGYAVNVNDYYNTPFDWFSISPGNFKVRKGSTYDFGINFNTEGLESGTYYSKFALKTDDPRAEYTIIPVTLYAGATSVQQAVNNNSSEFLLSVSPNPTAKQVNFEMEFQESGEITISIFDIQGRLLKKYCKQIPSAGEYNQEYYCGSLSEGIYFYKAVFLTKQGNIITRTGKLIITV